MSSNQFELKNVKHLKHYKLYGMLYPKMLLMIELFTSHYTFFGKLKPFQIYFFKVN